MNKVFLLIKNTTEELYFVSRKKSTEEINKDLKEFEQGGWKLKLLITVNDADFFAIKFKYGYNKHLLYRELYEMGAEFDDDETFQTKQNLVLSTARKLVIIANKCIELGYELEIPELVHNYIEWSEFVNPQEFKDRLFS